MNAHCDKADTASPHALDDLFKAVGNLSIAWAYVDFALTLWIEAIHDHWGGTEIQPKLPLTAFNRKLSYIRTWWKSDESNQIAFPMIPDFLDKLGFLAEQRHWSIHGAALNLEAFKETGVIQTHLRHKRDRYKTLVGSSDVHAIKDLTRTVLHWCAFLGSCISIFYGLDDDSNDAFTELVVRLAKPLPLDD